MIEHQMLGLGAHLAFAAPQTVTYSNIYAFGDSLSDAGNDYVASDGVLPTSAIYSDGRFSNGPVWVQDLAADLHLAALTPSLNGGADFAYGGAEAGQEPLHDVLPIDLPSQLAQFLADDPNPSANALYTLSIGANDVIDAIAAYAKNPTGAVADVKAAVNDETTFLRGLAADGARHFVILNVPDLGKTPEEAGNASVASMLSRLYDTQLTAAVHTLTVSDHLDIHLLNAYGLIDQAVAHPEKFGLTNVTQPVWTGNFYDPFSGTLRATGAAQDKFLFFDHLHPTETGHMAIAALALHSLG